jgi:hypothetical protein
LQHFLQHTAHYTAFTILQDIPKRTGRDGNGILSSCWIQKRGQDLAPSVSALAVSFEFGGDVCIYILYKSAAVVPLEYYDEDDAEFAWKSIKLE